MTDLYWTEDDVLRQLNADIEAAGSAKEWCRIHRMDESYISRVRNYRKGIGPKLCAALGVVQLTVYRSNRERPS